MKFKKPGRPPIYVNAREDGNGLNIRQGNNLVRLDADEAKRLFTEAAILLEGGE